MYIAFSLLKMKTFNVNQKRILTSTYYYYYKYDLLRTDTRNIKIKKLFLWKRRNLYRMEYFLVAKKSPVLNHDKIFQVCEIYKVFLDIVEI